MKHRGNVQKTCNYLRNVILGKDGEPKRCVRPGNRKPLHIMQNGKPLTMNHKHSESKVHKVNKNQEIKTQQQWNNMVMKRKMRKRYS